MIRDLVVKNDTSQYLKLRDTWDVAILLQFMRESCAGHDVENGSVWFYFAEQEKCIDLINRFREQKLLIEPFMFTRIYDEVKSIIYSYKNKP